MDVDRLASLPGPRAKNGTAYVVVATASGSGHHHGGLLGYFASTLLRDWENNIALAEPLDLQRFFCVGDVFVAYVFAGSVVDLPPRIFDDAEHHHQPASRHSARFWRAHKFRIACSPMRRVEGLQCAALREGRQ